MFQMHSVFLIIFVISAMTGSSQAGCDAYVECPAIDDNADDRTYCPLSKAYIDCLYTKVANNDQCSQLDKDGAMVLIDTTQARRYLRPCSGGYGLSSSLVLYAAGFILAMLNM